MVSVPKESVHSSWERVGGSTPTLSEMRRNDGVINTVRDRARDTVMGKDFSRLMDTAWKVYGGAVDNGYIPADFSLAAAAVLRLARYAEGASEAAETHKAFVVKPGPEPGELDHECIRIAVVAEAAQYFVPRVARTHGFDETVARKAVELLAQRYALLKRLNRQCLFEDYSKNLNFRAAAAVKLAAEILGAEGKATVIYYSEDDYIAMKNTASIPEKGAGDETPERGHDAVTVR